MSPPSVFPTYFFPSLPFRRRKPRTGSTESSGSAGSVPSPDTAPDAPSSKYLSGHTSYLRCARCATDLCPTAQIISKGFTGRHGRAYLVSASPSAHGHSIDPPFTDMPSLPNTHTHKAVPRQLVTGAHTVSDITCAFCGTVLGWKYVAAEEESQRYKINKYILETKKVCVATSWEGAEGIERELPSISNESMEFDSQDEDECEELFAGVWSPTVAAKRRQARIIGQDGGN